MDSEPRESHLESILNCGRWTIYPVCILGMIAELVSDVDVVPSAELLLVCHP